MGILWGGGRRRQEEVGKGGKEGRRTPRKEGRPGRPGKECFPTTNTKRKGKNPLMKRDCFLHNLGKRTWSWEREKKQKEKDKESKESEENKETRKTKKKTSLDKNVFSCLKNTSKTLRAMIFSLSSIFVFSFLFCIFFCSIGFEE